MSERAPLTQIRIAKICELMRALKWKRGVTVYELAKEWDIGESWAALARLADLTRHRQAASRHHPAAKAASPRQW